MSDSPSVRLSICQSICLSVRNKWKTVLVSPVVIPARSFANENDFIEYEEISWLGVFPDSGRSRLVTVDPKLAVSSQTSVVLKLNTRGHVPVGNTGKKI